MTTGNVISSVIGAAIFAFITWLLPKTRLAGSKYFKARAKKKQEQNEKYKAEIEGYVKDPEAFKFYIMSRLGITSLVVLVACIWGVWALAVNSAYWASAVAGTSKQSNFVLSQGLLMVSTMTFAIAVTLLARLLVVAFAVRSKLTEGQVVGEKKLPPSVNVKVTRRR